MDGLAPSSVAVLRVLGIAPSRSGANLSLGEDTTTTKSFTYLTNAPRALDVGKTATKATVGKSRVVAINARQLAWQMSVYTKAETDNRRLVYYCKSMRMED